MPKQPIRIIEGSAKPHEPFWRFRNAAEGEEPEMELYGFISEYSWWGDEVTPKVFKDDLYKNGKGGPITIRLNSNGGDVIAASVMRSIISEYPGRVTVKVDGIAASAATVVAIAADVVMMQESAYFMIHDPAVALLAWLNIEDLAQLLDELKTIKAGIVDAYETRTGMSRDRIAKLMTAETWFSAREAKAAGFIDDVITVGKVASPDNSLVNAAAFVNALPSSGWNHFVHVPEPVMACLNQPAPLPDAVDQRAAERLRAEIQLLVKG